MKRRHIILIAIAFAIVISCVGAASAGWFDFFDSDSDSDSPFNEEMGDIIDSNASALMIVESGSVRISDNDYNTSSADVKYNVTYSAKINISNLNDSSRKILKDALDGKNNTWAYIEISFNSTDKEGGITSWSNDEYDYKIEGDILYINGSSETKDFTGIFSEGTFTVKSINIQINQDSGEADPNYLGRFYTTFY